MSSLRPLELYILPGSSVYGIVQERIPEWVAMPSSKGAFPPRGELASLSVSCVGPQVLTRATLATVISLIFALSLELSQETACGGNE